MMACPAFKTVIDVVQTVAFLATAGGVTCAWRQLRATREQARTDFEDALTREYRSIARDIPTKAFLGEDLPDWQQEATLDEFFHYFDLSNEQVFLRTKGRISEATWIEWRDGMRQNLALPAFKRAWNKVKTSMRDSFQELRRLEESGFEEDPRSWRTPTPTPRRNSPR
jgi:hypothetical protein